MSEAGATGAETIGAGAAPAESERTFFGAANQVGFRAIRGLGRLWMRLWLRLEVSGVEHLPATGACIVAPNHCSYIDPVVLQCAVPRRLVFLMTSSWYERPLLRPFFRFVRAVSVEDERRNRRAIDLALAALARGQAVAIFPEGRVRGDGQLGPLQPGAASMALRTGAPIVPAAIFGSGAALPRGAIFPRPRRVRVLIGPPLSFAVASEDARRERIHQCNEELRRAIEALLARRSEKDR